MPWALRRSPLAACVPLEGSDTVQGLRTLERMRQARLLEPAGADDAGSSGGVSRRRAYQRFRGPFLDSITTQDLKQAPKPWTLFWQGAGPGRAADAYNVPASLDLLCERAEENLMTFLPNYLRLALGVVLATFYLRPPALLGAAAVGWSLYLTGSRSMRQQREAAEAAAAAAGAAGNARGRQQQQQEGGRAAADPNEQLVVAFSTLLTWLLVRYTRCLPIMTLSAALAAAAVALHSCLRRAPTEYRYKGRQLLGYPLAEVLGRRPRAVAGSDPWLLFRQLWGEARSTGARAAKQLWRRCKYYSLTLLDAVKQPFSRRSR